MYKRQVHGGGVAVPQYGTIPAGPCSVCGREAGVTTFVTRLYDVCLGRAPEAQGLADWCARLADHSANGRDAAYGFKMCIRDRVPSPTP